MILRVLPLHCHSRQIARTTAPAPCHVPCSHWRDVGPGLHDGDMTTTENMHAAISEFVAEHVKENPEFTGGFSYRVDIHRRHSGVEPFIFTSDDENHVELWKVSAG